MNPHSDQNTVTHLERLLGELSARRLDSAASGAALVEKARLLVKRLEVNDLERRAKILEDQITNELNAATAMALRSLIEK